MFWKLARIFLSITSPSWVLRWRISSIRHRLNRVSIIAKPVDRRVFVDVTVIASRDVRTGIQRVVRSTFTQMLIHSDGRNIYPIRYKAHAFRHSKWPDTDAGVGVTFSPQAGDVFLGMDLSLDAIRRDMHRLLRARRAGVRFWFVVYDLLPLQTPEYFSSKLVTRFRWWLTATVKLAHGYACISEHTASDLRSELALTYNSADIKVAVIPMGFEIGTESSASIQKNLPFVSTDVLLAVGTLEPRKGYGDLLDALEVLWANDSVVTLVIVGAPGWKTAKLQSRIETHAEFGKRLHWIKTLDDAGLAELYKCARGLVAASYGEGFGLPVLEAVARGCPVLARDIPAFRANAHYGLRFFPQHADADQFAEAIKDMLREDIRPNSSTVKQDLPTWRDTADALLSIL